VIVTVIRLALFTRGHSLPREDKQFPNPLAFLIFAFLYYFVKTSISSAVGGISMASVEGVAVHSSFLERLSGVSPVFVYLFFWIAHACWDFRKLDTVAIRHGASRAFNTHLAWFGGCVVIWVFSGAEPVFTFQNGFTGNLLVQFGNLLPAVLMSIFIYTWWAGSSRTRQLTRSSTEDSTAG